jgi:hypothetical protein
MTEEQKAKRRAYDKTRKHVATGRPAGGAQPGAGRKKGSRNVLPMGMIKAIKALNMRVPKDTTDSQKEILKETEDAILKVMRGKVHGSIATPVLKAAVVAREEICGLLTQKLDVNQKVGLFDLLGETEKLEQAPAEPPKEPVVAKGPIIRRKKTETVQ